ncbi:hypothetical protein FE257_005407 [Aspergillus nanangensis]|uniref:Protein kinase domain-containing protein n=1 Tax=Aspergillus nanangensis TaxID=2582783 RepID=A0AAD4CQI3_ASPNN|nr:hypothetical protein FE257_005407 [Aspergillus nanangensis]
MVDEVLGTGSSVLSIGETLNDRYRIIKHLGSGRYSTVWLAKDQVHLAYKVIKILNEDYSGSEHHILELDILKRLTEGDQNHPGYRHIPCLLDNFIHRRHVCLVLEPMAEDMEGFGCFFRHAKIPSHILKRITRQLLSALDYAHSLGIIHTYINQDNILVKIRDRSVIDQHLQEGGLSLGEHNFTDEYEFSKIEVVLAGWGAASWESLNHRTEMIQPQPTLLRAPEVLLQAPWGKEVDIWSLGVLLPELLDALCMFNVTGVPYSVKHHIEEIDALFGPFPPDLLRQGKPEIVQQIFDERLQIKSNSTDCPPARLETRIECVDGEEKQRFLSLLRSMMTIDPQQRMTVQLLQNSTWLTS